MTTTTKQTAFFLMGGPASEKSSVSAVRLAGLKTIDCDAYKTLHPDYDPKNILAEVHEWSNVECTKAIYRAIGTGETFVYDSTGTNVEKMVTFINAARSANFDTVVIYVPCSLNVALARNAKRARTVPEAVVREKYSTIATAFEIVSRYADRVEVIRND